MALLKSTWHTKKYPPSIHSHFWLSVIFPPGPIGPGLTSPSSVHAPASTSSFLTSGPGLGGSVCASKPVTTSSHAAKMIPTRFMSPLFIKLDVPGDDLEARARPTLLSTSLPNALPWPDETSASIHRPA